MLRTFQGEKIMGRTRNSANRQTPAQEKIQRIVDAAIDRVKDDYPALARERLYLASLVESVHNRTPLDLNAMEADETGSAGHDVFGIRRFYNPIDGSLNDGFSPRFALPATTQAAV